MNIFKKTNFFTLITKLIAIIMPVYVFLAVFLTNILHIPKAWFFLKEFLLILAFFWLIYEFYKAKKLPKFDIIDYLVFGFIVYGIAITLVNGLWLKSIFYGGRYDFMFLIVLLFYKHGKEFLQISVKNLWLLFIYSGAVSLLIGLIIKFRLSEEYLNLFGYVEYSGNWVYSGWVPNYHGLENSGMRRFQWIFDGPNAMAYFLIVFSGIFLYLQKKKREFYVIMTLFFLFSLVILTFSRSALVGICWSIGIIFLLNSNFFFKKYKKVLISLGICWIIFAGVFWFLFHEQLENIIIRKGSTSGHFERMAIGINRFTEKPFGAWLAESGPAFRAIHPEAQTKEGEIFYIPESWYIQLLVEWGIVYLWIFVTLLFFIVQRLYKHSKILTVMFIAVLIMNIFLHIFEATYISIFLFLFIWLFMKKE